jgi:hypothetical protein
LKNGKSDMAVPLIEEAEAMARTHTGDTSPHTLSLQVSHAEGLLGLRRFDEAASVLDALAALDASSVPPPLHLRAELLRGTLAHVRGDVAGARAALERSHAAAQSLGAASDGMRGDIEALQRLVAAAPADGAD